jgi:DNA polymerase-3 subunit beta
MEFSAARAELLKELDLVQGVVERKTTIPILSNLLLEAAGSSVRLSATDLELGIRCNCVATVKKEGSGTVPAKRLLDIVRSLPEAEVKFKLLDNQWVQLTCARSSFKLAGMARDNFPVLPSIPKTQASVPARTLETLIRRTAFAIANEESRYTLNGALLVLKPDTAMMVATDGHRLALIECDVRVGGLSNELRMLIPKKAMGELQKMLGGAGNETIVEICRDDNHLFFAVDEHILIARLLTGQFPNYEAVLPRDNSRIVEVDRAAFSAAIHRVALLADERSHAVRIQLDPAQLEVFSSSGEYGEAHESVDVQYGGEPMQIGFNYQYLLDFLNVLSGDGKIRMELKDEQSAGQLRPDGDEPYRYRYIVMPMRI